MKDVIQPALERGPTWSPTGSSTPRWPTRAWPANSASTGAGRERLAPAGCSPTARCCSGCPPARRPSGGPRPRPDRGRGRGLPCRRGPWFDQLAGRFPDRIVQIDARARPAACSTGAGGGGPVTAAFDGLPEQPEARRRLEAALADPGHAYLLAGPPAAASAPTPSTSPPPCCAPAAAAHRRPHPDLFLARAGGHRHPDRPGAGAPPRPAYAPVRGGAAGLSGAGRAPASRESANALLKSLEEPPAYGVFVLVSDTPSGCCRPSSPRPAGRLPPFHDRRAGIGHRRPGGRARRHRRSRPRRAAGRRRGRRRPPPSIPALARASLPTPVRSRRRGRRDDARRPAGPARPRARR